MLRIYLDSALKKIGENEISLNNNEELYNKIYEHYFRINIVLYATLIRI